MLRARYLFVQDKIMSKISDKPVLTYETSYSQKEENYFILSQTTAISMNNFVISNTNLIHTSLFTLLRFTVSTCFGHYLPILKRRYTNAGLVTVVCGCRCGLVSGCGKTVSLPTA
jgi:hypothetical protein